jgi:hypothetical protein
MKLEQFLTSAHCSSGAHCGSCRDREGAAGPSFRAMLGAGQFLCPYGKPWKGEPVAAPQLPQPVATGSKRATGQGGCGCRRSKPLSSS